jgi:ceramide glucosyltransferase
VGVRGAVSTIPFASIESGPSSLEAPTYLSKIDTFYGPGRDISAFGGGPMTMILVIAGWTVIAGGMCGAVLGLLSARAAETLFTSPSNTTSQYPPVTLLKPLCGNEYGLEENLAKFCSQDYPNSVQIVFGVQSADDPAITIVDRLRAQHPHADIELVQGTRHGYFNPKIANLISMLPSAKHDVLILSDSDIAIPDNYLRKITSALEQPKVGAVTCFYSGIAADNFWSKLAAMGIDYQFLPNAMLATATGLATPCFGSTIALRKSVLKEIGGFEVFRDRLADDYEIGRAIRSLGYHLAYPPVVLGHTCPEASAADLFDHELRWARTIQSVNGLGHACSIITHSVPLAMLGTLLLGFSYAAVATLGTVLTARLFQKRQVDRFLQREKVSLWLLPARDLLSFGVFIVSFFATQVDWRGLPYRVNADGALSRN